MADSSTRKERDAIDVEKAENFGDAHRARRIAEPAAASLETDAEAGDTRAEPTPPGIPDSPAGKPDERVASDNPRNPVPRRDPADTYLVDSGGEASGGPQEAPRDPIKPPEKTGSQGNRIVGGLIFAGLLVLLVIFVFAA